MYQVSTSYLEQMMKRGTRRRITGTIGNVSFTGSDIVQGSFSISARATEESDTKIGGVFLGQLEMTFVPSFLNKVARDQYKDKQVSISIGLYVDDGENNPEWIDVPIGVYNLQAPKISKQGISVSGYDNLQKLDKTFRLSTTTGTVYDLLSFIAENCGVTLAQTEEEIEALPNGTEILGLYEENDIETYRDCLYWLAQTCGCFACADREGKIALRKFGNETNIELDEMHRDTDVIFSGYTTKWTGVSFIDIKDQFTRYYGLEVDDGLTMNLGGNPFLQIGSAEAIERRRRNVLNAVAQIRYTPFYCNSARDPIFDLGDEIEFSGGVSGNSTGCVMSYSFSLDNFSFEGYGDEPDLANARSKQDKNISGLMQSTTENETTFYNFENLREITFGSDQEVEIANIAFTSAKQTTVKIMHEFIFDMIKDLSINGGYEVRYYYDNVLVPYKPYESLSALNITTDIPEPEESETEPSEDVTETYTADVAPVNVSICRDFFYILRDVEPNIRHSWKVKVITHGVTSTTIQAKNAHVCIEGQRLYGSDYWDGFIDVEDEISLVSIGAMSLVSVTDSCIIDVVNNIVADVADSFGIIDVGGQGVIAITDSATVTKEWLKLATEDHVLIKTEDGLYIRIEM